MIFTFIGAYVRLLEYNNVEGMIPHSELSRKRIRSIQKLIRVGRNEAVVVLRVDSQKGYIDLSKRRATPEDLAAAEDRYLRAKLVNQIIRNVADSASYDMEKLSEQTAWRLQKIHGDMYTAFKNATVKREILDVCDLSEDLKSLLINKIIHHLKSHPHKIRADIDVSCYEYEGIDAIKASLQVGIDMSTEDCPISIKLVAPPHYTVTTMSSDVEEAIGLITEVIEKIREDIEMRKGQLSIKIPARVTNEKEKEENIDEEDESESE
eukprot:Awhi_evm1s848